MTKLQWIVTASCILFFGILYFGFDTKPSSFKKIERSRALTSSVLDIDQLIVQAIDSLDDSMRATLLLLQSDLGKESRIDKQSEILKKMSGIWYRQDRFDIAGHYAAEVAKLEENADAWNIAGTTFTLGLQNLELGETWEYCYDRAIDAYQNALSIDPEYDDARINLALVYVEKAPEDNPMKGIQMLLEMNEKSPENVAVLIQLGKLSVRTNQLDRARQRFEMVLTIEKNNPVAICYLADIYNGMGDMTTGRQYAERCKSL